MRERLLTQDQVLNQVHRCFDKSLESTNKLKNLHRVIGRRNLSPEDLLEFSVQGDRVWVDLASTRRQSSLKIRYSKLIDGYTRRADSLMKEYGLTMEQI